MVWKNNASKHQPQWQTLAKQLGKGLKKKKKKLLLFFKYLCWKNVFFKRPDYKCLRLSGGQAWPLLQIFLLLFFLSNKKITALKRKVNAIPNSWTIVCLLQLQSKAFKTHLNSRKLLFKRDLMSTAVIKINPSEIAGMLLVVSGHWLQYCFFQILDICGATIQSARALGNTV